MSGPLPEREWAKVDDVNRRFPEAIHTYYGDNAERALGVLRVYDALLVNSALDGMNLVAQEGALVNVNDGVIVLSRGVGSSDLLGEHPISIPGDASAEATAMALGSALRMPQGERHRRAVAMRSIAARGDLSRWMEAQLVDLASAHSGGEPLTAW